jgi:PAS domain S-box-containing protein
MHDQDKTKEQLLSEIQALRRRVSELEALETGHRRTEEALRESEETTRALLNAPSDSALLLEPDGTIIALNQTTARHLGRNTHELVGANIFDLFPPDVTVQRKAQHDRVLHTGQPVRYEDERAGMWFDNNVYPIFAQGKVVRLAVFASDITERKQAEAALQRSEERWRTYIEQANDLIFTLNASGEITSVNQATCSVLNYTVEELLGKSPLEFVVPQNRASVLAALRTILAGEDVNQIEIEAITKDGRKVLLEVRGRIVSEDNQVVETFHIARDVSERRAADEALRKKTYQQERLLETARHLTASLDLKEVLTRIGIRANELLEAYGCTIYLLEADGRTLTPVVAIEPAYEKEILSASLDIDTSFTGKAIKARQSMIFNDALHDPSGYQIPGTPFEEEERIIATPFIVDDRVLGAMCLNRIGRIFTEGDLALAETFASYAETALKNAQTHLALRQEVEDRNRAEEALRQSMVELSSRNEELDAFAHTVAHDLQNPLAIIIGMADVLQEECTIMPLDQLRAHLLVMAQSGRKMNRIIDELLLLAQVRKGQVQLARLTMGSIVAEAQQRLAEMIEQYQAEIVLPDRWPPALGYGPWVEQVWINYLSNAIKYGGRPPRVELGATPETDGSVRFWVRDNGPGLTPQEQARLFTPFTRLDNARASGQGLGLSIVRRVIDKLGGQVGLESNGMPGQGSVFSFTLPSAGTYDSEQ